MREGDLKSLRYLFLKVIFPKRFCSKFEISVFWSTFTVIVVIIVIVICFRWFFVEFFFVIVPIKLIPTISLICFKSLLFVYQSKRRFTLLTSLNNVVTSRNESNKLKRMLLLRWLNWSKCEPRRKRQWRSKNIAILQKCKRLKRKQLQTCKMFSMKTKIILKNKFQKWDPNYSSNDFFFPQKKSSSVVTPSIVDCNYRL